MANIVLFSYITISINQLQDIKKICKKTLDLKEQINNYTQ